MVHYTDTAVLMPGLPGQIAQYNIGEGKKEEKTEKYSFCMRVSNNIHNVPSLDEVEFIQEWTEEEKIPVKASPITPVPKPAEPKADAAKEGESKPAEGEAPADGEKPAEEKPAEEQK